jgi:hypothetical protein
MTWRKIYDFCMTIFTNTIKTPLVTTSIYNVWIQNVAIKSVNSCTPWHRIGKEWFCNIWFKLNKISHISQVCSGIACGLCRASSGTRSVRKTPVSSLVIYCKEDKTISVWFITTRNFFSNLQLRLDQCAVLCKFCLYLLSYHESLITYLQIASIFVRSESLVSRIVLPVVFY